MNQMSMRHSFYIETKKEKHINVIVAVVVVVDILFFVSPCRLRYKMEGMGE